MVQEQLIRPMETSRMALQMERRRGRPMERRTVQQMERRKELVRRSQLAMMVLVGRSCRLEQRLQQEPRSYHHPMVLDPSHRFDDRPNQSRLGHRTD